MPIWSFTRFTAFTASPSEAPGARLKESVTTGNWPWWFTVMGTAFSSTRLKALSGTWPPVGNTLDEAIGAAEHGARCAEVGGGRGAGGGAGAVLAGPLSTAAVAMPPETRPVRAGVDSRCRCG